MSDWTETKYIVPLTECMCWCAVRFNQETVICDTHEVVRREERHWEMEVYFDGFNFEYPFKCVQQSFDPFAYQDNLKRKSPVKWEGRIRDDVRKKPRWYTDMSVTIDAYHILPSNYYEKEGEEN